jgi:hypothetical protein
MEDEIMISDHELSEMLGSFHLNHMKSSRYAT